MPAARIKYTGRWCASLRRQSLPMGNYEAADQIAGMLGNIFHKNRRLLAQAEALYRRTHARGRDDIRLSKEDRNGREKGDYDQWDSKS